MRKANLYAVMTAAAVSMAILSGCSGSQTAATTAAETTTVAETTAEETTAEATEAEEEDEENYDTGDASMDNTRNQDRSARELLVVSFGTSYNDSRRLTGRRHRERHRERIPGLFRQKRFHKHDHH